MKIEENVWDIRVHSLGGNNKDIGEQESWTVAMERADAHLAAKDAGHLTGDDWLDQNSGKADQVERISLRKAAEKEDGFLQDIGRIDPEIIQMDENEFRSTVQGAQIVSPPVSFFWFYFLVRNSPSLKQNIEAYCRSIDGHGYQLIPILDITDDKKKTADQIRAVIYNERLHQQRVLTWMGEEDKALSISFDITDGEIEERKKLIETEMPAEKARLELFFNNCNPRETLTRLRRKIRTDKEICGNAWWAIKRNPWGEPLSLWWIPAKSTRAVRTSNEDSNVEVLNERIPISPISYDNTRVVRAFRRYAQGISDNEAPSVPNARSGGIVYFKEVGDPRVIGNKTGQTYKDRKALEKAIKKGVETDEALEVMHFSLPETEHSVYGMPRWQGCATGAMGEIEAEQSNLLMLRNDAVPDMIIMCEGGRFAAGAVQAIEKHLKTTLKGKNRTRGVLTLEAAPAGKSGGGVIGDSPVPKIHIVPLTQYQREDALYTKYMEREGEKIDSAFGNPPMAVGKYKSMNRATADVLMAHAEQHIYQPERQDFDDIINQRLLPIFGTRYWKFKSNAPVNRDSRELVELAEVAVTAGIINIDEARMVVGDAFSKELTPFESDFSKIPLPVYLAQLRGTQTQQGMPGEDKLKTAMDTFIEKRAGGSVSRQDVIEMLSHVRKELVEKLSEMSNQAVLMGIDEGTLRDALGRVAKGEGEKIEVSASVLKEWVMPPIPKGRTLGDLR